MYGQSRKSVACDLIQNGLGVSASSFHHSEVGVALGSRFHGGDSHSEFLQDYHCSARKAGKKKKTSGCGVFTFELGSGSLSLLDPDLHYFSFRPAERLLQHVCKPRFLRRLTFA